MMFRSPSLDRPRERPTGRTVGADPAGAIGPPPRATGDHDRPGSPAGPGPALPSHRRPAARSAPPGEPVVGMRRRPTWRRGIRLGGRITVVMLLGLPVFVGSAVVVGVAALVYGNLAGTIPEARPVRRLEPSHVYVMNADGTRGEEIASFREFELALPMRRQDVPQVLKDAVVSSEDRQFWSHKGVDPVGIARAAYVDVASGATRQGASTITQQVVREKYLSREQTIERKFNEVLLATRYERDLNETVTRETGLTGDAAERETKERIMFEYLSQSYFGGGAYGAAAAAETYFHKHVQDLTPSEAATLVGILPSPTAFSPRQNLVLAEQHRRDVLKDMLETGALTDGDYALALDEALWWAGYGPPPRPMAIIYPPPRSQNDRYPYVVDHIRKYLEERYGDDMLHHGGLQVYASLDPRLQAAAEASVATALAGTTPPLEMSLVSVEPATGMVKALVGGRDFNDPVAGEVNLALSKFPPGSSFKAFTVATALEQGLPASTAFYAPEALYRPGCRGSCEVGNAVGGESGYRDMVSATGMSINTWFVLLIERIGVAKVVELADRLGVHPVKDPVYGYNYQLTLGKNEVTPLEMASGYGVFANRGVRAEPVPVARVLAGDGHVLEDNTQPHGIPVMNPVVADWTSEVLRAPIEHGTATGSVKLDRVAAGKTGTIDGHTNAWFVGYTPQLSTAVWVGHRDSNTRTLFMPGEGEVFGAGPPARTWNAFMNEALAGTPVLGFTPPAPLPPPDQAVVPLPGETIEQTEVHHPGFGGPRVGDIPRDCGGPCVVSPVVTAPAAPPTRPASTAATTSTTSSAPTSAPAGKGTP
jgi:membrane peptidoglycan carboxypeptidase